MSIQQIKSAIVLAEKLHFTQAAKEVNIVQPALSRQIQQLENELGVSLFKRHKRKVELTEAGTFFIQAMKQVLSQIDQINQKTKDLHQGATREIRIGFTHSVMQTILPQVIQKIRRSAHTIRSVLKEINNLGQFVALQRRELDIGFATNPVIPANLKGKKLSSDNFVVLLPPGHPVTQKNFKHFSVFANEEFIFPPAEDGTSYLRILESICTDAGFTPKVTHVTGSASTSFKLVEKGFGICIEPKTSLNGLTLPIKAIELKRIPQKAELTMIWNDDFEKDYPALLKELSNPKNYKIFS